MQVLVILRNVMGLEVWQVYTKDGLVSQHWSKDYADAAAQRLKTKAAAV